MTRETQPADQEVPVRCSPAARVALLLIRLYQFTSPVRPPMCRYHPTCSHYAAQCIQRHGIIAGVALGIRRILRCNPFCSGGYDPAP